MNNSESLEINLVGGGEKELRDQILKMQLSFLLRVKEIINIATKKGIWYSNITYTRNDNTLITNLIGNLVTYAKNFKNKSLFDYIKFIDDTIIVKKLKEKIIKLANSSKQKNINNIDDPKRNTYIKDIKELLHLI